MTTVFAQVCKDKDYLRRPFEPGDYVCRLPFQHASSSVVFQSFSQSFVYRQFLGSFFFCELTLTPRNLGDLKYQGVLL